MPAPNLAILPCTLSARHRIEAVVEALIALLDALDGDADDEPWLGSVGGTAASLDDQRRWASGTTNDAESDVADEAHDELGIEA